MAAKQLVLVTGINGYLGSHIVDQLVKAGYSERGTVRSGKLDAARESNAIYGTTVEVIVADDLAFGNFTEALKGVNAVIHAASPLFGRALPEEALTAAIEGAMNVLRQTEKMGIKRFVLVSSLATVASVETTSPVWTDKDWIEVSREQALTSKDPHDVYVAEKVLAERAVWGFANLHPHVDITTLNPPFFLGPYAPSFRFTDASLAQMGTNSLLYLLLDPEGKPPIPYLPSIDVRDVARAAVHALTAPPASEVGRKRLLFLPHFIGWKDVVEHIAEERPELRDRLSRSAQADFHPPPQATNPIDNSRAVEILKLGGLNDWKTTVLAGVDALVELEKKFAAEGKTFH
ncbi:NAD-P-binding protein [Cubamyces sp. BRFM 1775]|nr:NAD-P-binding protein [Cubamyces sp. BRFM 1775]